MGGLEMRLSPLVPEFRSSVSSCSCLLTSLVGVSFPCFCHFPGQSPFSRDCELVSSGSGFVACLAGAIGDARVRVLGMNRFQKRGSSKRVAWRFEPCAWVAKNNWNPFVFVYKGDQGKTEGSIISFWGGESVSLT